VARRSAASVAKRVYGWARLRPAQKRAIDQVLQRRDTLVVLPTGFGKSAIYQVAALLLPGPTVVVSPLIALMKDQIDFLTGRGIDAARLDSSLALEESRAETSRSSPGPRLESRRPASTPRRTRKSS